MKNRKHFLRDDSQSRPVTTLRHRRQYLLGLAVLLCGLGYGVQPAQAEGSSDLYPSAATGSRANLEWRTDAYGGIVTRRTLLKVFANAGENILVGSSAVGQGSGDILIFNPNRVFGSVGSETIPGTPDFNCSSQVARGVISSRTQELAGPKSISGTGNLTGYTPCYYQAPTTGVYDVVFYGSAGGNSAANGGPTGELALTSASNFNTTQGSSVAAWDVTVRSSDITSVANLNGRLFSYYLALFTGNNGRTLDFSVYPVTTDGYRYRVDVRGLDPNGFVLYGSQVGFYDSDGKSLLYHDINGQDGQISSPDGGTSLSRPQYATFLNSPDTNGFAYINLYQADGSFNGTGLPFIPIVPSVSSANFAGNAGANTSVVNTGGTFSFSSNVTGNYEIVISRDGINFDPTNSQNRALRGIITVPGTQSISWNGKDNSATAFPVGNNYAVHIKAHAGEYHFPLLDAENNFTGGPSITLLNATNPLGNTTGFYDDRGYTTVGGVNVGTPGNVLCGINPPSPIFSDPINGFDTSSNNRKFGQSGNAGNANTHCNGSFGDTKGLDLWTYFPSSTALTTVNIIASASADLAITKAHSPAIVPEPNPTTAITYTIAVTNNGSSNVTGAAVADTVPAVITGVTWTCTISTGTGSCGAANGSGNTINTTVNLNNGATATYTVTGTLNDFVAPNTYYSGSLANTATVTAPSGVTDSNAANNTAVDTISQPHVRLVKRITAIRGTAIASYIDVVTGAGAIHDNAPNWINSSQIATKSDNSGSTTNFSALLQGAVSSTVLPTTQQPKPGDAVEYTIYFLSDGGKDAANVQLCDFVPANSTYVAGTLQLKLGASAPIAITDATSDADGGYYTTGFPGACNGTNNSRGALVVNVGTVNFATGSGVPATSYGYIRFQARID